MVRREDQPLASKEPFQRSSWFDERLSTAKNIKINMVTIVFHVYKVIVLTFIEGGAGRG